MERQFTFVHAPNSTYSADAGELLKVLAECQEGASVAYSTLTAAIGRDVRGSAAPAMRAALRRAEVELGIVFRCVRGEGYARLTQEEIARIWRPGLLAVARSVRRTRGKLDCADAGRLSDEGRRELFFGQAVTGVLAHCSDGKRAQRTLGAVAPAADAAASLSVGSMLDMFKR